MAKPTTVWSFAPIIILKEINIKKAAKLVGMAAAQTPLEAKKTTA